MNKRIASLDVLRNIAITFVLLLHSQEFLTEIPKYVSYVFSFGWIGVDLFFVLSGFLIGSQTFNLDKNESSPIKRFLTKRFFRTLPLYYFILLIYLFIKPLAGFPFNDTKIKYLFFLQNFFSPKDFVQSWSLCIEEQFYFIFPILFYKFKLKKIPSYMWLIPSLFSVIIRLVFYNNGIPSNTITTAAYNYHFNFFTHLDGISWGLFLASTFKTWSLIKNKHYFLLAGIFLLFISLFCIGPYNLNSKIIITYQILAISFSLILIGVYDINFISFNKSITNIAKWSYGIYLWNNLTARLISKSLQNESNTLKFSLFIFSTITLSALTYYVIEKPTLKLKNKFLSLIK